MTHNLLSQRRVGVLLHPTSLPSGKLDSDAERWQFLDDSGFSVWQVLPLGEPQVDLSPYQCSSAFALNPALFDDCPDIDTADAAFREFCDYLFEGISGRLQIRRYMRPFEKLLV